MGSKTRKWPRGRSWREQSTAWSPQMSGIWSLLILHPKFFFWICFFRERLCHSPCSNEVSLHITVLNLPEASRHFNRKTEIQESTVKTFGSHHNPADTVPSLFALWICCRIWLNWLWYYSFVPSFLLGFWRPHHSSTYHPHALAPLFIMSLSSSFIRQDHAVSQTLDM